MSIAAIVILFLLGGIILGSSLMWFEAHLHSDVIPRSMTDLHNNTVIPFDAGLWYALLLVCAGVGLPLGMYVLQTLHDCEDRIRQTNL